jgi:hypothetical protein
MLPVTLSAAGLLLVSIPSPAAARPHHHTSTHALVRHTETARSHHFTSEHASYATISPERATEIQSALIKQGYLSGEPSGTWDSSSVIAMQKLQGDNGWQTKLVPDSRALIKLGLGPNSTPTPSALVGLTTTASN